MGGASDRSKQVETQGPWLRPRRGAGRRHTRFEDTDVLIRIDCYGGIAGAIAGAMAGAEAFPAAMLDQVVESNLRVYGVDLEAAIERFIDRCL